MFRNLRRALVLLFVSGLLAGGYRVLTRPGTSHRLMQIGQEAQEWYHGGADKKMLWQGIGLITKVLAGDLVRTRTENRPEIAVRLAGIDAPETPDNSGRPAQPLAIESQEYLHRLAGNKAALMQIFGTDAFKRPVAVLFVDGTNLNVKMVEAGLAEIEVDTLDFLPVKLKYAMAEAQQSARQLQCGIWGLTNYQSPSEYRLHRPGRPP